LISPYPTHAPEPKKSNKAPLTDRHDPHNFNSNHDPAARQGSTVRQREMPNPPNKRKSIPKSIRFEVLKRDKFTCQYCGNSAPDVILHIDHIDPVANDGRNDVINLITSCEGCNLGKSDKLLSDDSAIKKAKNQLDELQERREQLEMMMEWQRGLRDLAEDTITEVCRYWEDLAPGFSVNDNGKMNIKKWMRRFSLAEVTSAMDIAAEQYLQFDTDERVTGESWEIAFGKVSGICRVTRESQEDPDIKELYYIRAILRNRLSYYDPGQSLQYLKNARSWGVSLETLRAIARDVSSWTAFKGAVGEAIGKTDAWQQEHNEDVEQIMDGNRE
jgi:hypothetical protein